MTIEKDTLAQGINEHAQALAVAHIIDEPLASEFEGMTLFSFTDGWWKAGNPTFKILVVGHRTAAVFHTTAHLMKSFGVWSILIERKRRSLLL